MSEQTVNFAGYLQALPQEARIKELKQLCYELMDWFEQTEEEELYIAIEKLIVDREKPDHA